MTEHAITQWLEGLGLGQDADAFRSEQIDLQALPSLTEEHLERLGVAAMGHRVRILQAIAELDAAPADAFALRDLVERLPTPVALPLAEYVAESDLRLSFLRGSPSTTIPAPAPAPQPSRDLTRDGAIP